MTPYTLTISGEESDKVYRALKAALFCAKQQASIHVIGADQIVAQINDALDIMNRPCQGGFESNEERNAHHMANFMTECARYGCD